MLEREELERQFEAVRESQWVDRRMQQFAQWSKRRRTGLRQLIEPIDGNGERLSIPERFKRAHILLNELDATQRDALWQGLFPKLAPHLVRACQEVGRQPYQAATSRFPFRAPHHAETLATVQARFFVLVCDSLGDLNPDIQWLATFAAYAPSNYWEPYTIGQVLAAALRNGGREADAVRSILIDSINGDHEIGIMGHHCTVALLNSDERSDWEIIGKLLLAAQRQEGLRQAILEVADEAEPRAFRYILGLILARIIHR